MQQGLLTFHKEIFRESTDTEELDLSSFVVKYDGAGFDFAFSVLDAYRIRITHAYDKLSSLSNSRTRLLPHQIEATHRVVNSLRPRFILADEVGLGKTIEAGLVMKELMLRKGYKRIFVAAPAPLTVQWQQEMKNKFNEEFTILTRKNFAEISSAWSKYPRIITSIDFIKNERYAEDVLKHRWDIAVFDEAHRLRRDYAKATRAYSFAEKITEKCDALLLLSATPFRGKLEELFYLVRLVDPYLLGPHTSFVQEYVMQGREGADQDRPMSDLRERLSRVMVRRRKVEVGGFTKRFACTIRFDLSPEERAFYDETTDYVRREYNLAMQEKNRAVGFVMIVFQKLLDSSTRALLRALERRKAMLEQRLHGPMFGGMMARPVVPGNPFLPSTTTMMETLYDEAWDEDEDTEETEENLEKLDQDDPLRTIKDLRREILTLSHLIQLGRSIKQDRKLVKLKETIHRLRKEGSDKFIIFTQFRSTQDYLAEHLSEFKTTLFHGSLNMQQKEDAVQEFKRETEVFICTEAGGEGRNLQFSNVLINYDLPWSPLKVEQRIGRVHRFGQTKDVYIFNFSTRNTVAERILEVLEEKIRLFEESIGPSDALLGAVEDDSNFQNLIMQFVSGKKSKAEFDQELDSKLKLAEVGYRKLNELVTPQFIDFNLDDYYAYTKQNRVIENEELERMTLTYLEQCDGEKVRLEKEIPRGGIAKAATVADGKRRGEYRIVDSSSTEPRSATFRSDVALENEANEFLAVGHPLVDRALDYFLKHRDRRSIQILKPVAGLEKGYYFVFVNRYLNGLSRAELLSCMVPGGDISRAWIPGEILIPPGFRITNEMAANGSSDLQRQDWPSLEILERIGRDVREILKQESEKRGRELKERLHSIFKKEEYKMEISYFKKIRQLEEKRDRQMLRYRMEPKVENRATLTRTENELSRARSEMELEMEKIRRESRVETSLDLLQIYCVQ